MSKEEVYKTLISMYKLTPSQIAEMTPYQQLVMLRAATGNESTTMQFDSMDSYYAWLNAKTKD